jgi:DNA-binding SARP family transcriptional activator
VVPAKTRPPRLASLRRERLDELLDGLWSHRICLVVAPAGSGKTTLLDAFAARMACPVAWYRAESWDNSLAALLRHLEVTLTAALGELPGRPWRSVEDVAAVLEAWRGSRAVLVVDDLDTIEGTEAEAGLERLLDYAPARLWFLAASRSQPRFNLSRLRVAGALLEVGGDDLRFRSWEAERLFHDLYREPMPPAELAKLARRTEGWAAGLMLFHLATRGKDPEERRQLLERMGGRTRLVHEYLANNVIGELPEALQLFLIETCVLGRLSASICDRLLGRHDSHSYLSELERRQIFIQRLGDDDGYRYNEVLRSYLEGVLARIHSDAAVRERFRWAGRVLEESGNAAEAFYAYCRAEDWAAVARLPGARGPELVHRLGTWVDVLPLPVLEHDPWLLLARARRHRADGTWPPAVADYERAEALFATADMAETCRSERHALVAWLEPRSLPTTDLLGQLRAATRRAPAVLERSAALGPTAGGLLEGLRALLAGNVDRARRALRRSAASPGASGAVAVAAGLGLGMARLLAGDADGQRDLTGAVDAAERLDLSFLARLGQACLSLGSATWEQSAAVRDTCIRLGDGWGAALAGLLEGWARVRGRPDERPEELVALLQEVAGWFGRMEAAVLEAWAWGLAALAIVEVDPSQAAAVALRAERLADACSIDGPRLLAYLAQAGADPVYRERWMSLASDVRAATGLGVVLVGQSRPMPVDIRLFGGFRILAGGVACDLSGLRPRARTLLRLLAARVGSPVHRETLQEALWPEAEADAGAHNLHVALSSLRKVLEVEALSEGGAVRLERDGDAYRLSLGRRTRCDLLEFQHSVETARLALSAGDGGRAVGSLRSALRHYVGELLPEDGAADWVGEVRDRCRVQAAEAAQSLAQVLLQRGDSGGAVEACMAGLQVDRYQDRLWRLLIEARRQAGDAAAAERVRLDYRRVLSELDCLAV